MQTFVGIQVDVLIIMHILSLTKIEKRNYIPDPNHLQGLAWRFC